MICQQPERTARILQMRLEGYSYHEISLKCGISEASARVADFRGKEKIREILGEKAVFAPAHLNYLRPSAAGVLAMAGGRKTDYLNLEATYLRPPNAQKNKKLLEAMGMKQE